MASVLLPVSENIWDFDPTIVPGCALWFDAADASSVTVSGSNVTAWRDKSGNARNITPTTNAFQYVSAFNGSYPAISGVNTGGNGTIGSRSAFTLSNPSTVFAVFQNTGLNSGTSSFPYLFNAGSGSTRTYAYAYNQTTTPGLFRISAGGANSDAPTTVNTTTAQVFSMQMGATSTLTYQNGTLASTSVISGATLSSTTITIGGNSTTNAWTGYFCEFILYNATISTSERQQIEGYLAWKWGLQASLGAGHPYLNTGSVVRPFLRAFQPTDITTPCMLWFDGGDATTLTLSGSNVTAWRDKSGNANNIPSFASTQPTYNSATGLLTMTNGNGTTTSNISLSSTTSYSVFYAVTFSTGLTDTGASFFTRPFNLAGTPSFFVGFGRGGYTVAVSGATISGSNTTYNVASTSGLTTGNTVTIAGITLGSATGYNGTGVVQSFVTNTSITVNITSTGTPTSFVGATVRNGTSNVAYYAEGNAGGGPYFFFATSQGFNTYAGSTFIVSFSQTGATSYTLSVNGNATSQTAATSTMANRQVLIGAGSIANPYGLGELLLYNGALTVQDRQRVEGYLIWKWGAQRTAYPGASTNIATSHPFYRFPSAMVTPFDPRILDNTYMWYDGADMSSLTLSGSTITAWNDKSGNGNNLTTSAGPTRTSVSTNPVGYDITFNGTTSFMWNTSLAVAINSTSFSYFTVFINNDSSTGYGRIVSAGTTSDNLVGDTSGLFISNDGATTSAPFKLYCGKATAAVLQPLTKGTYHIVSLVFTSTPSATAFYDGTQVGTFTPASATFNFTKFSLGRHINTGNPLNGVINESLAFTSALTTTQRQQMEGYLAWKWGINSSLPTTHAYYKVRP